MQSLRQGLLFDRSKALDHANGSRIHRNDDACAYDHEDDYENEERGEFSDERAGIDRSGD